nr:MAG TPA: transcription initiation factor [Bacteriophage sp.]
MPGIPPGSICFYSHSDIVWTLIVQPIKEYTKHR